MTNTVVFHWIIIKRSELKLFLESFVRFVKNNRNFGKIFF